MTLKPERRAIAYCSLGYLGIIESSEPKKIEYSDGGIGFAWTGRHISPERFGKPWSSRSPKVIFCPSES